MVGTDLLPIRVVAAVSRGAHSKGNRRPREARSVLPLAALSVVVLSVVVIGGWNLSGGKLLVMETPSMCPSVCVGALVADRPLQGPLHVGELITFHPPNAYNETYTHEISKIFPNGMIQTRGVGNPEHDPWLITRSDIVGEGVFSVWGLGWLYKALPLIAVGVMAWVLVRPLISRRSKRAWDRGWATVLAILPVWMLHPLVRATSVSTALDPSHPGWARQDVVNTGILPVSFRAAGGQIVEHVRSGGLAHVVGPPSAGGSLMLRETVSLYSWGWVILVLVVLSPLAGYLWHAWRDTEARPGTGEPAAEGREAAAQSAEANAVQGTGIPRLAVP